MSQGKIEGTSLVLPHILFILYLVNLPKEHNEVSKESYANAWTIDIGTTEMS